MFILLDGIFFDNKKLDFGWLGRMYHKCQFNVEADYIQNDIPEIYLSQENNGQNGDLSEA